MALAHNISEEPACQQFLASLRDEKLEGHVQRHVLKKGPDNSTVQQLLQYVEEHKPGLVLVASEKLAGVAPDLGSFSLTLVKQLPGTPAMVVKKGAVGAGLQGPDELGRRPSLKVLVDVNPTCRSMLEWVCRRLNPAKGDKVVLGKARGVDS